VLSATGDLAATLRVQGKVEEAEALATAALADMRRVLGNDASVTLSAEQLIAEGLAKRGNAAAAEALARDVLARARSRRGDTDPIAINALVALARVLDTVGKTEEAERFVRQALERVVSKGARRINDRLLLEDLWAELLEKGGRVDQAVAVRRRLADATEDLHGPDSPLTATALTRHALAVAAQAAARGDHAQAAEIYGRIRDNYVAALGTEHPDTVSMEARWQAARERAVPGTAGDGREATP
jgi:tetratricopeptide (TPR) repeat protein